MKRFLYKDRVDNISDLLINDELLIIKRPCGKIARIIYGIYHSYEPPTLILKDSIEKPHIYDLDTKHLDILLEHLKQYKAENLGRHNIKGFPSTKKITIYKISNFEQIKHRALNKQETYSN